MAYQKTAAGIAEVQNRSMGLRAELRRLLIMVDGQSPLDRYKAAFPTSDVAALAKELEALGLIADPLAVPLAAVVSPTDAVKPPAQAGGTEPPQPTAAQFNAARQAAVRFINDQLGTSGESLALRLERCADPDALRAAVRDTRTALDRVMGTAAGQRFIEHVRNAASNVI